MLWGTDLTIKRIKSLNGMGVFRSYTAANDETDLKKLNLIYGFNGSGKTTLSRIFACLERGKLSGVLPEGGKFEIELEDGTVISHESNLDALKAKVAVFNSDFVDENFQWKEGSARPVFYIGKEQADKGRELRESELLLDHAREKKSTTANAHQKIARAFAASKTETARNIGEQTNHRAFNARHLDGEFAKGDRGSDALINDDRRKELRAIILQDAPLPKVELLGLPGAAATEFPQLVRHARACLEQTVAASTLSDLAAHPDMLGWVKAGHDYHVGHALADCLFCGNPVSRERLAAIEAAIDDRFDRIVAETSRLSAEAAVLRERLTLAATAVPSKNDIVGDPRAFEVAAQRYREGLEGVLTALTPWEDALRRKSATPNARIEAAAGIDDEQAETLERAIDAARSAVNDAIMAHNTAHDEFANRQSAAKRALLEHYLAEACATYRDLEKQVAEAEGAATSAATDFDELDAKVERLREELRNHGSAAAAINGLIKAYLRHGDIEIVADDEGFQLRRQGGQIAKHLSEGEKTAITLCYFLSSLASDGRKLKDLVVVVDDPISSLDSKALNYAFSVLKGHVGGALQLILLTHNVNFMNECRKWLKGKVDKGVASLLFIELKSTAGARQSILVKLPTLLREYDSEYHYLFSLVKAFAESEGKVDDYLFLMPNAMRKVAEVFLAFKRPGNNGLGDKVDALAQAADKLGIDADRFRAIDRLVQVESHGDSLEDLITFSSMTVEEAHQCAAALMEIIEKLDSEHYKRQCGLCK